MTLVETPLYECLIYSLCVYGVYWLFRQLKFPDISTDNVFSLGSISFAFFLLSTKSFLAATLLTLTSGFIVGSFTALLYAKLKIPKLLCGIITYSILFSINLKFFNRPNISIPENLIPSNTTLALLVINGSVIAFVFFLYRSKLGKAINTFGNNPAILREFHAPTTLILLLGSGIANAFISLSGGLTSVYFGFSDVGMGTGLLINSVAAIIIAENIMLYFPSRFHIFIIPVGVFVYNLILFLVISYFSFGFLGYTDYKLVSGAVIILFFLTSNKKAKEIVSF
jgi:putative tryptophan/tyrosine transport system permease protein